MNVVYHAANFLLATAQWLILGRLVLGAFIRNEKNPVWQLFLIATDPPYRVSRLLTGHRVPDRWLWLVSLAWLMAARLVVTGLGRATGP